MALCQQDIKPITRDNLISSIRLGNREKKAAARYIELINRYGVDFSLTPQDEQWIRRTGKYLGKKGLDDLVAAIKSNYHPNVAQQPTAMPTPEKPKPNLTIASYGKLNIIYDPATRTFKEGLDKGISAVVVHFRNAHELGKEITDANDIRAHIYYEPFEYRNNLNENLPGFTTANDGVWFREVQPVVNFARGETKALILAIQIPNGEFGAFEHPIEQREGLSMPFPLVLKLTADKYRVKVQITGGANGEVYEFYVFTLTLRPEFSISYG